MFVYDLPTYISYRKPIADDEFSLPSKRKLPVLCHDGKPYGLF